MDSHQTNQSTITLSELLAERRKRPVGVEHAGVSVLASEQTSKATRDAPFPLTDIQQAYWIGRQPHLELGGVSTHGYSEIDAERIDPDSLHVAINRLIERHDMLRAVITSDGMQQILPQVGLYHVKQMEVEGKSQIEVEAHFDAVRAELSHQMFELGVWPMFEMRLTQLPGKRSRIHFSVDLMLLDDTSIRLLFSELAALLDNAQALSAKPLQFSYQDYVLRQKQGHDAPEYVKAQAYWRKRIAEMSPPPDLPIRANSQASGVPVFSSRQFRLSCSDKVSLMGKATQAKVTLTAAVVTIFSEILRQWSKAPSFTLNLTMSNRQPIHESVDRLLGNFTSLALLDVKDHQQACLRERMLAVQAQLWEILENQAYSGVAVMRDIARRNGDFTGAQMPVVFTSALAAGSAAGTAGYASLGKTVFTTSQTPQVRLDHQLFESGEELVFNWDSVDQEFPPGMLDDMFSTYERFVRILLTPDVDWSARPPSVLPSSQEAARLRYNATASDLPKGGLHHGFLRKVSETPDAVALITPVGAWTYRELWHHVAACAADLRDAGMMRGDRVAILMPKGPEQVVAALAILLQGAVYLPLDIRWPTARRELMLHNADARLLVVSEGTPPQEGSGPSRVSISMQRPVSASPLPSLRTEQDCEDDIAYIIYTSGSTGVPKGVAITHRAAHNTISAVLALQEIGATDRFMLLSELSFDLSVHDIFGALSVGAAIVIPRASEVPDVEHWADLVRTHGVTIWNSVPALLEMYVDFITASPSFRSPSLRFAMASGDWIPVGLPRKLKVVSPCTAMWSLGGATEAGIWSIYYPIDEVSPEWQSIPYGRPLPNQTVHVLDEELNPRPLHVPGDIYIGGVGLARGYWNDPERTGKQFIRHPRTGEALYKTGDLGRFMDDTTVQFLGRVDNQVKISGFRIELGEIEAQMERVDGVSRAACLAVTNPQGHRKLIGFVVANACEADARPIGAKDDSIDRLRFKQTLPGRRRDLAGRRCSLALEGDDACRPDDPAYFERRSFRSFTDGAMEKWRLSALLKSLARATLKESGLPKARYGSAGSLYPVQCYLSVLPRHGESFEAGDYYYDAHRHELIKVDTDNRQGNSMFGASVDFDGEAAIEMVLVADVNAIEPIYGDKSLHLATLEAGMMTQLLEMAAPLLEIGICQIGMLDEGQVRRRFELGDHHRVLHGLLCGRVGLQSLQRAGYFRDNAPYFEAIQALGQKPEPGFPASSTLKEKVKDALEATLPPYMQPSRIEVLAEFPLTANGKIDRKQLPLPSFDSDVRLPTPFDLNANEQLVMKTIRDVMGVPELDPNQNFFDAGADSLMLVRIHSRLQLALDRHFPIVQVFRKPTVRDLCGFLFDEGRGVVAPRQGQSGDAAEGRSRLQLRRSKLTQVRG